MKDTMIPFVGRKPELGSLDWLLVKMTANLVVIKGLRCIGKSRLIDEFARQLASQLGLPGLRAQDWGDLFDLLAKSTQKG